jgi:hypothetical protein
MALNRQAGFRNVWSVSETWRLLSFYQAIFQGNSPLKHRVLLPKQPNSGLSFKAGWVSLAIILVS